MPYPRQKCDTRHIDERKHRKPQLITRAKRARLLKLPVIPAAPGFANVAVANGCGGENQNASSGNRNVRCIKDNHDEIKFAAIVKAIMKLAS